MRRGIIYLPDLYIDIISYYILLTRTFFVKKAMNKFAIFLFILLYIKSQIQNIALWEIPDTKERSMLTVKKTTKKQINHWIYFLKFILIEQQLFGI